MQGTRVYSYCRLGYVCGRVRQGWSPPPPPTEPPPDTAFCPDGQLSFGHYCYKACDSCPHVQHLCFP